MRALSRKSFLPHSENLWKCASTVFEHNWLSHIDNYLRAHLFLTLGPLIFHPRLDEQAINHVHSFIDGMGVTVGICLDFRWSHRRNALEGTLTVRTFKGTLITRTHILRKTSESDDATRTFTGSAKSMEGAAVETFFQALQHFISNRRKQGLTCIEIGAFVHDQDSSTTLIVRKYWSAAKEFLDLTHAAKNIKKRVAKQCKGWGENQDCLSKSSEGREEYEGK